MEQLLVKKGILTGGGLLKSRLRKEEIVTTKTNGHKIDMEETLQSFLYSYGQLDANAVKVHEASAHLYSLIEPLVAKGITGIEESDQRKRAVEKRLSGSFKEAGIGVTVRRDEVDKYSLPEEVKMDCEKRKHICRAACCMLAYPLSFQDSNEGICWSLGKPLLNARGADGYCVHWQRETPTCSIYEHCPAVSRQYDCHNDRRIWLDFEKMTINPDVFAGETLLIFGKTSDECHTPRLPDGTEAG